VGSFDPLVLAWSTQGWDIHGSAHWSSWWRNGRIWRRSDNGGGSSSSRRRRRRRRKRRRRKV